MANFDPWGSLIPPRPLAALSSQKLSSEVLHPGFGPLLLRGASTSWLRRIHPLSGGGPSLLTALSLDLDGTAMRGGGLLP